MSYLPQGEEVHFFGNAMTDDGRCIDGGVAECLVLGVLLTWVISEQHASKLTALATATQ